MARGSLHQESTALARLSRREGRPRIDRRILARFRASNPALTDHAPFVCVQVCLSCGRLREPPAAHPMRDPVEATMGPCDCGASAWADLGDEDLARKLAEVESFELRDLAPARRTGRVLIGLATAITLSVAVVLVLIGAKTYAPLFSLLSALFAILVVPGYVIDTARELARRRRALPWRWSLALPPTVAEEGPPLATGPARTIADPLVAPLSGRPCVGWEVRITRGGASPSAAPALMEQRCADFTVEGHAVAGARTLLRLPLRELSPATLVERSEMVQHYLRRHGLLDEDGPWILAEAVLEAEAAVTVVRAESGFVVRPA